MAMHAYPSARDGAVTRRVIRRTSAMLLAGLLAAGVPLSAVSAACPQALAVYEGESGTGGLTFIGSSHELDLQIGQSAPVRAYLTPGHRADRTEMTVPIDCPEGDVTGEELAACLAYQSTIYALNSAGEISSVPDAQSDAATTILLPDLANLLAGHPYFAAESASDIPDVFRLAGCQE
ncbi:hypothetical protein [Pseudohoeflea coraliihabitans]|uniref:Uncharacterized protein n=1 Tax=Pseudohoeflea coraliihabitans TaxID=2860393 RepID=A0ABS6WLI9_9HYPH|nr:hypothetical protein [Pseudohoeflea sp. DP4N28-3]MBW3096760.1 hypothetical protein [Pseudohoeflea sp. DP4N28-3]